MSNSRASLHYDLWSFSDAEAVWDMPKLALRHLHRTDRAMSVTACRGDHGLHFVVPDTEQLESLMVQLRPTVMLVGGTVDQDRDSRQPWALRFILSPKHSGWANMGARAPERDADGREALRMARSIQATVAWNQPSSFPTLVGGAFTGAGEELERRLTGLLSDGLAEGVPLQLLGAADILPQEDLRVGLREFLGEHPLLAPLLEVGLDRLHDYVVALGAGTTPTVETLKANGAERVPTSHGELIKLPEWHKPEIERALMRAGLLPGGQSATARGAEETLGEFRLPGGQLFLTRRRKRELEEQGYWIEQGPQDETLLIPLEPHCASIGISEEDGLEIVVQQEHAARLRELLSALAAASGEMGSPDTLLTVYAQALKKWPLGGFFGPSTDSFLALLRRTLEAGAY